MTADPFPTGPHRPVRIPHLPPLRSQRRQSKDDANTGSAPGRRPEAVPQPTERGDLHP